MLFDSFLKGPGFSRASWDHFVCTCCGNKEVCYTILHALERIYIYICHISLIQLWRMYGLAYLAELHDIYMETNHLPLGALRRAGRPAQDGPGHEDCSTWVAGSAL